MLADRGHELDVRLRPLRLCGNGGGSGGREWLRSRRRHVRRRDEGRGRCYLGCQQLPALRFLRFAFRGFLRFAFVDLGLGLVDLSLRRGELRILLRVFLGDLRGLLGVLLRDLRGLLRLFDGAQRRLLVLLRCGRRGDGSSGREGRGCGTHAEGAVRGGERARRDFPRLDRRRRVVGRRRVLTARRRRRSRSGGGGEGERGIGRVEDRGDRRLRWRGRRRRGRRRERGGERVRVLRDRVRCFRKRVRTGQILRLLRRLPVG